MKSIFTAVLIFLALQPAQAAAKQTGQAERLFSVLKKSGLPVLVPFKGAEVIEAYEVTCVATPNALSGAPEVSDHSCDLASHSGGAEVNSAHLVGLQAKRLFALLRSARVTDGESGASTAFIRCGKYVYQNVEVNYDCQVATPFGQSH